jgi:hypothetical protein
MAETAHRFELAPSVRYHGGAANQALARFRRNIDPRCMDTDGFYVHESDRQAVEQRLNGADLVWIQHLQYANALRRWYWPRTVLDLDNVASRLERSRAGVSGVSQFTRSIWRASLWRRREKLLAERFRHVVVCSEDDRRYLDIASHVHVIPNTFDDTHVSPVRSPTANPRFGFIGTLKYQPNRDAVDWFGRTVWPEIRRALPDAEWRVIGEASAEFLRARTLPGVGLGYLRDPTEEMATWTAMIVPIRIGGGTRVKISEAFVRRIPVLSTSLGAFGYDVTDGRELLLADDARTFSQACVRISTEPDLAERLTAAANDLYRQRYSVTAVRHRVAVVAEQALREERGKSRRMAADAEVHSE